MWGKLVGKLLNDEVKLTDPSFKEYSLPKEYDLCKAEEVFGRLKTISSDVKARFATSMDQIPIPYRFVSATHFSISMQKNDYSTNYYLTNYSKNSIFINTKLKVGTGETKKLNDGDEILLRHVNSDGLKFIFYCSNLEQKNQFRTIS